MPISENIRQAVRNRADFLCEYCHSPERSSADMFTIDHLLPRSLGGSDEYDNLALACRRCNERRYNFTAATDPQTGELVSIFNPRKHLWKDHFSWTKDALTIVGVSEIGRATCFRLDMNDNQHNKGFIKDARWLWVQGGWHPPNRDPRLGRS